MEKIHPGVIGFDIDGVVADTASAFLRLASDKYRSLGLDYKAKDFVTPTKEEMATLLDVALAYGIDVKSH